MLEAYNMATNSQEKAGVDEALNDLAQHLSHRAGLPIQGAKYRPKWERRRGAAAQPAQTEIQPETGAGSFVVRSSYPQLL
jgi:hypothetical protein